MSKRHGFTDHRREQFTRTLKMSKATACLLIMLGIQPYPFVVAIPDESKTDSSHVGPEGYGRDPASLLRPGGRLSLKSDLSRKYGIRGAGGETVPDFTDEPGMDESIDEFDTVSFLLRYFVTVDFARPFQQLCSLVLLYHCRNSTGKAAAPGGAQTHLPSVVLT